MRSSTQPPPDERTSGRTTLGIDVGGTFTDVAMWDGTAMTVGKVPSAPRDQSEGVIAGARGAVPTGARADLLHGTTVGTNALLERRGARTLLVTDAGFESLIEIARQDRPSLYDPFADRARALADPGMRIVSRCLQPVAPTNSTRSCPRWRLRPVTGARKQWRCA